MLGPSLLSTAPHSMTAAAPPRTREPRPDGGLRGDDAAVPASALGFCRESQSPRTTCRAADDNACASDAARGSARVKHAHGAYATGSRHRAGQHGRALVRLAELLWASTLCGNGTAPAQALSHGPPAIDATLLDGVGEDSARLDARAASVAEK